LTIGTGGVANASIVNRAPTSSQIQIKVSEIKESNGSLQQALLPHEQIAGIQRYLSMNVTDLAKALRIARPTVYAWMRGSEPHDMNSERISLLYDISRTWREMSSIPVGKFLNVRQGGGASLLEQLSEEQLQRPEIFESLARVKTALDTQGRRQTIVEEARARGLRVVDTRGSKEKWSPDDDLNF